MIRNRIIWLVLACSPLVAGTISFTYNADDRTTSILVSDPLRMTVSTGVVEITGNPLFPTGNADYFFNVGQSIIQVAKQDNAIFFNGVPGTCQLVIPHSCWQWDGTIGSQEPMNPNLNQLLNTFQWRDGTTDTVSFSVVTTPEPGAGWLVAIGGIILLHRRAALRRLFPESLLAGGKGPVCTKEKADKYAKKP